MADCWHLLSFLNIYVSHMLQILSGVLNCLLFRFCYDDEINKDILQAYMPVCYLATAFVCSLLSLTLLFELIQGYMP